MEPCSVNRFQRWTPGSCKRGINCFLRAYLGCSFKPVAKNIFFYPFIAILCVKIFSVTSAKKCLIYILVDSSYHSYSYWTSKTKLKPQGGDSQNFSLKFIRFFVTLGLKILRLFRLLFEADIIIG